MQFDRQAEANPNAKHFVLKVSEVTFSFVTSKNVAIKNTKKFSHNLLTMARFCTVGIWMDPWQTREPV